MNDLIAAFHQLTPADQAAFAAFAAKELPARGQVELVRVVTRELSAYYGVDMIERGCVHIESNLDVEDEGTAAGIPYIPQYDRRAQPLNLNVWSQ